MQPVSDSVRKIKLRDWCNCWSEEGNTVNNKVRITNCVDESVDKCAYAYM